MTRSSEPPRFSHEERELLLRQLRAVQERVDGFERETKAVRDLARDFQELKDQVIEMLNQDVEQSRAFGQLSSQVASLVATVAAHAGGQVGGMTGEAAGLDAARLENKHSFAKMATITMIVAAVTSGVVQGIVAANQRPIPLPQPTLPK